MDFSFANISLLLFNGIGYFLISSQFKSTGNEKTFLVLGKYSLAEALYIPLVSMLLVFVFVNMSNGTTMSPQDILIGLSVIQLFACLLIWINRIRKKGVEQSRIKVWLAALPFVVLILLIIIAM